MRLVGLTGGIGSGKSTVGQLLAARGAVVIDADLVAREVVQPGEPALDEIVTRFGRDVLDGEGRLDRPALAAIVFGDDDARRDLEAITHPRIGERILARIAEVAGREHIDGEDHIIIVEHPLLIENGQAANYETLVVVLADEEVRLARLTGERGMDEEDARARMRAQATDEERRRAATHVVENNGTTAELQRRVDEVWTALTR
ncbi:MAG: dephospho-CoA kinase [Nitriliruptorales bacterium]|nr:dephospho-CoA kinase [Nitriliruptorales bacterium]